MIKSKNLLILAFSLLVVFLAQNANADLSCEIINATYCAEEHIVLKLKNVYGDGYDNAHAELKNYTTPGYPYAVCCNSTTQEMNNTCDAPESTVALRLHNETNSHVQAPNEDFGAGNYSYDACIAGMGESSCVASEDCGGDYVCLASIASSEDNEGRYNSTNAHIASCGYYDLNICCSLESPPQEPVLISPNSTVAIIDRTPLFNWSYPGDEPNITYKLQLSEDEGFLTTEIDEEEIEDTFLASSAPLEDDLDLNKIYFWRLRAVNEDNGLKSEWVTENFTIDPYVAITITQDNIDFGSLSPEDENDTTDDDPPPFSFRNDGNVEADLYEVNASQSLWTNAGLNNENWQIRARENATAFNTASSKTSFVNVETTIADVIGELNFYGYHEKNNEASVDIKIIVPTLEPPGEKTSTLTFSWKQHE